MGALIEQFGKFIQDLGIKDILGFSNGLSALALILATLLILATFTFKRNSWPVFALVVLFLFTAVAMVFVDKGYAPAVATVNGPVSTDLEIASDTVPNGSDDEPFPIHIRIDGEPEWDVMKAAPATITRHLTGGRAILTVNANIVARMLYDKTKALSEVLKRLDTSNPIAHAGG